MNEPISRGTGIMGKNQARQEFPGGLQPVLGKWPDTNPNGSFRDPPIIIEVILTKVIGA
jgi:hypothetical protein